MWNHIMIFVGLIGIFGLVILWINYLKQKEKEKQIRKEQFIIGELKKSQIANRYNYELLMSIKRKLEEKGYEIPIIHHPLYMSDKTSVLLDNFNIKSMKLVDPDEVK